MGVTLADSGTYFTVTSTAAATDSVALTVVFSDTGGTALGAENTITVNFTGSTGGTTYTLQAVVDLINTASQNINLNDADGNSLNYAMASAELDTSLNTYKLKLISRGEGADLVDIDISAAQTAASVTGFISETTSAIFLAGGIDLDETGGDSTFTSVIGTGISIATTTAATAALIRVTSAIKEKDENRAMFGYKMNRLETTIAILDIQSENLMAAESRISDVDVATEMATLTRTQVLSQAGVAMLAQANTMPQMALTLLR
jgi:flagellin